MEPNEQLLLSCLKQLRTLFIRLQQGRVPQCQMKTMGVWATNQMRKRKKS
jgi:hypothetical protein